MGLVYRVFRLVWGYVAIAAMNLNVTLCYVHKALLVFLERNSAFICAMVVTKID